MFFFNLNKVVFLFENDIYICSIFCAILFCVFSPLPPDELAAIIYEACGEDHSTASLTQVSKGCLTSSLPKHLQQLETV